MTLAIGFKGSEGIVLAADSRVTLQVQAQLPGAPMPMLISATYDNATKLLKVAGQDYVAAVTYDAGAFGLVEPRTAHSLLPEFEAALGNGGRLSVEEFSRRLGDFFLGQWNTRGGGTGPAARFIVGGYDEGQPYGRLFLVSVPNAPVPVEVHAGDFGIQWGGQTEITSRILNGYDDGILGVARDTYGATDVDKLRGELGAVSGAQIPYQFLPLQDCVDLSVLLIKTTAQILDYHVGIRGVGGSIDLATLTPREGFQYVQRKQIRGERLPSNLII